MLTLSKEQLQAQRELISDLKARVADASHPSPTKTVLPDDDLSRQLADLTELWSRGALNDVEFDTAKNASSAHRPFRALPLPAQIATGLTPHEDAGNSDHAWVDLNRRSKRHQNRKYPERTEGCENPAHDYSCKRKPFSFFAGALYLAAGDMSKNGA